MNMIPQKKRTSRPTAHRAITLRVVTLALSLWLAAMALLTWAVAEDAYRQIKSNTRSYAITRDGRAIYLDADSAKLPGAMEAQSIRCLGDVYHYIGPDQLLPIVLPQTPSNGYGSEDWIWGKWDLLFGFEVAEAFYNTDGEVLLDSGNYLSFYYTSAVNWVCENTEAVGLGYLDLDSIEGGLDSLQNYILSNPSGDSFTDISVPLLRLTGYFEGNCFHPTKIARGDYFSTDGMERNVTELNTLDQRGLVQWTTLLDTTDSTQSAQPTVQQTIYAWDLEGILSDYDPLRVNERQFDSLTELLHADGEDNTRDSLYRRESLLDSVIVCKIQHEDRYGIYTYGIAVRCWPLAYAAMRMIPTYLVSLGLLALAVWLILRNIRHHLTEPLERLTYSTVSGTTVLPHDFWAEPQALAKYMIDSRQELADTKTQLQQTKAALSYAQHAEENRRQLVSNITHELKTPLAVIHSYVEGLQEGIAEEKRDHYLSVIQDETQRMDAMVLQMLDLSRLEAGKVRLTMENFSLLQLVHSVADRFAPMLESKEIQLHYGETQDFLLTADEGRIEQVITNLVSNALKYTDIGGRIYLNVAMHDHKACFSIENTAEPLSDEALNKVWDSFYRADPARTEPGTGLGLTLVKSIVELHRGTCYVRNHRYKVDGEFENRVEFGFSLPI